MGKILAVRYKSLFNNTYITKYRRPYNSIDAREMMRDIDNMKAKIPDYLYSYEIVEENSKEDI